MNFRWLTRLDNESEYYIEKCFKVDSLMKLYTELEEAEQHIKQLQSRIHAQYQVATQTIECINIYAYRQKNEYSSDKKVKIVIQAKRNKYHNETKVSTDTIYGDSKEFGYREQHAAIAHIKNLLSKYEGSRYINETPYKTMEV